MKTSFFKAELDHERNENGQKDSGKTITQIHKDHSPHSRDSLACSILFQERSDRLPGSSILRLVSRAVHMPLLFPLVARPPCRGRTLRDRPLVSLPHRPCPTTRPRGRVFQLHVRACFRVSSRSSELGNFTLKFSVPVFPRPSTLDP